MPDNAGFESVQADKTKPAHDLPDGKKIGEQFFVSEAVLERENGRRWPHQRRDKVAKLAVRCRFKADDYQIANSDFVRRPGALRPNIEVTLRAQDSDSVPPDHVEVRAEEEMNILAIVAKLCPVITSQCTAPHDANFHGATCAMERHWRQFEVAYARTGLVATVVGDIPKK
jgi:hypothetical protein